MRAIGDSILYAMKNTATLALLLVAAAAFAQPGFNRKYNSGVFWETYFNVLYHDGHLTAPGCVTYDTLNYGFMHTELDTNGNVMSSRYLPVDLPEYVENWYGSPIIQLRNGNVMSATGIHVPGGKGYLLAIHDGEELKTVKKYVNLETFFLLVTRLCETDNAVYLSTVRQKNDYKNKPLVQRLDKDGNMIWEKEILISNYNTSINSVFPLDNNTIILAGGTSTAGWVPTSQVSFKSFITAIDSSGNTKWKWESTSLEESNITGLKQLPDGGWLYATGRFDPYSIFTGWVNHSMIVRRDSNLNLVWKKQINSTNYAYVCDLELTPDGNCVAATTWSYPPPSPDFLTTAIYKLSLDGEVLWARDPIYLYDENPVEHVFGGVEVLPSGSIVAAGWITRYNEGARTYGWLVKMSPDGCIYDNDPCVWWPGVIGGMGTDEAAPVEKMRVFPNPATDFVHIELPGGLREPLVRVFDWQGREVLRQPADGTLASVRLDVAGLAAGVYVVAVSEKGRVLAREKLVVAK